MTFSCKMIGKTAVKSAMLFILILLVSSSVSLASSDISKYDNREHLLLANPILETTKNTILHIEKNKNGPSLQKDIAEHLPRYHLNQDLKTGTRTKKLTSRSAVDFPDGLESAAQRRDDRHEYETGRHKDDSFKNSYRTSDYESERRSGYETNNHQNWLSSLGSNNGRSKNRYQQGATDSRWSLGIQGAGNNVNHPRNDAVIQITEMKVPELVIVGEDVTLTCDFKLKSSTVKLYNVNWWRNNEQFYTYKESMQPPMSSFTFEGIVVDERKSGYRTVVLKNVSEATSGKYKCEVMGEAPAFKTAVKIKEMTVIVPPKSVRIDNHWEERLGTHYYSAGEKVDLKCTASESKPRAKLRWKINGEFIEDHLTTRHPDRVDHADRFITYLGLKFIAPDYFSRSVARVECIADVEGHLVTNKTFLYLDSAASALYNHQLARASGNELGLQWLIFTSLVILFCK